MSTPPALDWTKEQVAEPTETHERCRRCKGRGWYFGSHFHAGGSPGVCGWCGTTGLVLLGAE